MFKTFGKKKTVELTGKKLQNFTLHFNTRPRNYEMISRSLMVLMPTVWCISDGNLSVCYSLNIPWNISCAAYLITSVHFTKLILWTWKIGQPNHRELVVGFSLQPRIYGTRLSETCYNLGAWPCVREMHTLIKGKTNHGLVYIEYAH